MDPCCGSWIPVVTLADPGIVVRTQLIVLNNTGRCGEGLDSWIDPKPAEAYMLHRLMQVADGSVHVPDDALTA